MAFDPTNLNTLNTFEEAPAGAARSRKEFRYFTTADAVAAVSAGGYFNASASLLQVGDLIVAICTDGHRFLLVTAAPQDGTNVTVANKAAA